MDISVIRRRRWIILGVLVVGLPAIVIDSTVPVAASIAMIVGSIALLRWMPGKRRPTLEEMEQLIAEEIAAAERDLAAGLGRQPELSRR